MPRAHYGRSQGNKAEKLPGRGGLSVAAPEKDAVSRHMETHAGMFRSAFALDEGSKLNCLVQFSALGATGAFNVRIIRINKAATLAFENTILTWRRPELASAQLRIETQPADGRKQDCDIRQEKR